MKLVRDIESDVEIGVLIERVFYKKIYSGKLKKESFDSNAFINMPMINYVLLEANSLDITKLISDLCLAKSTELIQTTDVQGLETRVDSAIQTVTDTINEDILVFDPNVTRVQIDKTIKLESAIKFSISSNGIPLEGRGSGFKKNLAYSLLTKSSYVNVVLAIDEIENSLSVAKAQLLITKIVELFPQTIITTHSPKMVEVSEHRNIIARSNGGSTSLSNLYAALDPTLTKHFILVEGKFDVPWIKKALSYVVFDESRSFIVLPSGGSNNIDQVARELENQGKSIISVKDGDVRDTLCSLPKDIIEMFTPLEQLNQSLDLELQSYPESKEAFFAETTSNERSEDSIKSLLATCCIDFIDDSNALVNDLKIIIENQLRT